MQLEAERNSKKSCYQKMVIIATILASTIDLITLLSIAYKLISHLLLCLVMHSLRFELHWNLRPKNPSWAEPKNHLKEAWNNHTNLVAKKQAVLAFEALRPITSTFLSFW